MPGEPIVIERTYRASVDELWTLWTTPAGIESWWAPDGFTVTVTGLDAREGGELVYTMTATAPEQVEFMQNAGMPLVTESRKRFVEVRPRERLVYTTLVDFVPDVDPYEFDTTVELEETPSGARVVMTIEPMHDGTWTERLAAGRANELDNLARLLASRNAG